MQHQRHHSGHPVPPFRAVRPRRPHFRGLGSTHGQAAVPREHAQVPRDAEGKWIPAVQHQDVLFQWK